MNIKIILIIYLLIVILHFLIEYISIKNKCKKEYNMIKHKFVYIEKPKLDYCFYRALFFPITWIRMMWKYTK